MEKTTLLVLMYSVIAVAIMNITYIARIHPALPCTVCFEEDEWKVLYCTAHKTKTPPEKPYTIAEAVTYLSWLGGPRRGWLIRAGKPSVSAEALGEMQNNLGKY
jgi:hypothetical protein